MKMDDRHTDGQPKHSSSTTCCWWRHTERKYISTVLKLYSSTRIGNPLVCGVLFTMVLTSSVIGLALPFTVVIMVSVGVSVK